MAVGDRIILTYIGYRQTIPSETGKSYCFQKESGEVMYFSSQLKGITLYIGQKVEVTETDKGVKSPYKIVYEERDGRKVVLYHFNKDDIIYWNNCQKADQILIDSMLVSKKEYEDRVIRIKREIKDLTVDMDTRRRRAFIFSLLDI